ncbi:MAG: PP2C family protein-serine/threonine phosphatase [Mycobacterium sp.]
MALVLRYAARSDRGLVRANNEDSVYAGARLLALADGMGGHAAGEVASQLVIGSLAHLDEDEPGGDLLGKLDIAVRDGNASIAAHVRAEPNLEGMGTTLTAILFAGGRIGLVHIGDSRGYLMRDGELVQITKDDTFVQTLVDEGRITAEEAHSHPQRSLIMRALTGHEVEPTLIMREARVGDRYLLCSDGLSDPVSFETIAEALKVPDVAEAADRLIELALRGGGPDNVTVVVADVIDYEYGQTQPILAGAVSGIDDYSAPPNTAAGRASAFNPRRNAQTKPVAAEPDPPHMKSWYRRRWMTIAVLVLLLVVAALGAGRLFVRSYYYVTAHDDVVSIMRGVDDSFAGISLNEPFQFGCLSGTGALSLIDYGEDGQDCEPFKVQDLRQSEQASVIDGLPAGSKDEAINRMQDLADKALPLCTLLPPPEATATTTTQTTTTQTTTQTTTTTTTEAAAPSASASAQRPPDVPGGQGPATNSEVPAPTESDPLRPTTTTTTTSSTTAAPTPSTPAPNPGVNCRAAA